MKHFYLSFLALVITMQLFGQKTISTKPENRPVVLEEYTGVNCGYCPDGHQKAQAIYDADPFNTVLINVHAGGYANPSAGQPDFRTSFGNNLAANAGVTGYPSGTVNRHKFDGATATELDRGAWASKAADLKNLSSPVNVGVSSTFNETSRELTVNVELYYTDNSPQAKNFLHVAFLENGYIGYQADYASGNKTNYVHNHILRNLLTGQWGAEITTTTKGTSHNLTYTYTVPAQFDINKCDVAVFVSESKNEIYSGKKVKANGGQTLITSDLTNTTPYQFIEKNAVKELTFTLTSELNQADAFMIETETEMPDGWAVEYVLGGQPYVPGTEVTFAANESKELVAKVTSNDSKGLGTIKVSFGAVNFPETETSAGTTYLFTPVKDLVVSHIGNISYVTNYNDGLDAAQNEDHAAVSEDIFFALAENLSVSSVKNIYYNVGWSFPGLSPKMVDFLTTFLDNGGNLFIAGQDIGWDIWDATGRSNHAQSFYTNYLKTKYINDGAATTKQFIAVAADPIFGTVPQTNIIDAYGSSNIYPEQLQPLAGASAIFKYEGSIGTGGIRVETDKYKVVYLGINFEQMGKPNTRLEIMKRTHDWFNGIISSSEDIDENTSVQIYPNPTASKISVVSNGNNPYNEAVLMSMDGKVVANQVLNAGVNEINAQAINQGSYLLKLNNTKTGKSTTKKIQVVR